MSAHANFHFIPDAVVILILLLAGGYQVDSCQPPPYSPSAAAHGTPQFHQYVPPPQPVPSQAPPAVYQYHPPAPSLNSVWPIAFHSQNGVQLHSPAGRPVEGTLGGQASESPFAVSAQEDPPSAVDTVERCQRIGVRELSELVGCTDIRMYDVDATMAKFGTEKCSFEVEYVCRFYSVPDEALQFRTGSFRVPGNGSREFEESFAILTRRNVGEVPQGRFLMLVDAVGNIPSAMAILKTDVGCQRGDGMLNFDYWATQYDIQLRVCTRQGQERRCTSNILYAAESSRIDVQVVHPGQGEFAIELIVSGFKGPGALILDNLVYEGDLCEEAEPLNSQPVGHPVLVEGSIDGNGVLSGPEERSERVFGDPLRSVSAPVSVEAFDASTAVPTVEPEPQTVAEWTSSSENGISRRKPSIEVLSPPAQTIMDPAAMSLNSGHSLAIRRMTVCELVECAFGADLCHYFQPQMDTGVAQGKWQVSRTQVGNVHTGIRQNNTADLNALEPGFAYVGTDNRPEKAKGRTVYILESPAFTLENEAQLLFDLYRRSNAILLQVCLDTLNNCPYIAPPLRTTIFWREAEQVRLPRGTRKIFFVATQWKRFKWLAIDNVRLQNVDCSKSEANKFA